MAIEGGGQWVVEYCSIKSHTPSKVSINLVEMAVCGSTMNLDPMQRAPSVIAYLPRH